MLQPNVYPYLPIIETRGSQPGTPRQANLYSATIRKLTAPTSSKPNEQPHFTGQTNGTATKGARHPGVTLLDN
jgi:hypothetical protein